MSQRLVIAKQMLVGQAEKLGVEIFVDHAFQGIDMVCVVIPTAL